MGTLSLSPLVSFVAAKDTSHHHVRKTKQKVFTQMEGAVSCAVIHRISPKIVDYEHGASSSTYTGFTAAMTHLRVL
jgi:hypothetical protein